MPALFINGKSIELNAKEYKIIEFLMENKGRVHTKNKYMKGCGAMNIMVMLIQ